MKPFRVTLLVRDPDNPGKMTQRALLVSPDAIVGIYEDVLIPFEKKGQGLPIVDKNFSLEQTPCRTIQTKTNQKYPVTETMDEIQALWDTAWCTSAEIPPPSAEIGEPRIA